MKSQSVERSYNIVYHINGVIHMGKNKKQPPVRIYGTGKHEDKYISFGADAEVLLHNYDEYEKYVKACEQAVRKDARYDHYIHKIREAGFDHCAILGDATKGGDKVTLEMHHGPIFSLFDICDIVLKASLRRDEIPDLTTYDIADLVLTEHEKDNIQICMLSKPAHKGGHNNVFVHIRGTVGRIDRFITRWKDGMEDEHWGYIERYIEECAKADGTIDGGLFDTAEKLKSFK